MSEIVPEAPVETQELRISRFRKEFSARYMRYWSHPRIGPLLKKLKAGDVLEAEELNTLDNFMKPLRFLKDRYRQVSFRR